MVKYVVLSYRNIKYFKKQYKKFFYNRFIDGSSMYFLIIFIWQVMIVVNDGK